MSLFDGKISTDIALNEKQEKKSAEDFEKEAWVSHHHHSWERQGFVGTGKGDIQEIFECTECDAWTAIDKPQDTRQQWRLGSVVEDDEDEDEDEDTVLHEHDSMDYLGRHGETLGFLCHCGEVHELTEDDLTEDEE
jgi:hypothetical protein